MQLFVGLGNPGPKYAGNRHNIGFVAIDRLAERWRFSPWRARFQGEVAEGDVGGIRVLALKPKTYMNESGRAVAEAARFYKIDLPGLVVFHDELDLAPGKVRVKVGGGNAGHNGLRSITAHLGNDYRRVRIGIGHPGHKDFVLPHVLGDFAKSDRDWVGAVVDGMADAADRLAQGDDPEFQNRVHRAMEAAGFGPVAPKAGRETD